MKLTTKKLKQIIKEEIDNVKEGFFSDAYQGAKNVLGLGDAPVEDPTITSPVKKPSVKPQKRWLYRLESDRGHRYVVIKNTSIDGEWEGIEVTKVQDEWYAPTNRYDKVEIIRGKSEQLEKLGFHFGHGSPLDNRYIEPIKKELNMS